MPKNPGANEYEIYQIISLMSRISKRIIKILINIARSRIRPAIGQGQWLLFKTLEQEILSL